MPRNDSETLHDQVADTNKKLNEKAYQIQREQFIANEAQQRAIKRGVHEAKYNDTLARWLNELTQVDKDGYNVWERLMVKVNEHIKSGQSTIHDWRSAMMDLLAILSDLVPLMQKSLRVSIANIPVGLLNPFVLKETLREKCHEFKDKIVDKLRGDPRINIPTLVHDVSLDDDNKLNIGRFKTANKGEDFNLTDEKGNEVVSLNDEFETLVKLWLYDNHYVKMDDGTFVNNDANSPDYNQVLPKQKFEELKNDAEHGLNHFLETNSELKFSSGAKP